MKRLPRWSTPFIPMLLLSPLLGAPARSYTAGNFFLELNGAAARGRWAVGDVSAGLYAANCCPCAVSSQLHESSQNRLPAGGLVPDGVDDKFYERADAHIHLSNEQLEDIDRVRASASMMYATARFNAWVSARGFGTKEEMAASREETIDYFLNEYRLMLEENLDDYVEHFAKYMTPAQ
jgi:hypothetical protein